MLGPRTRLLLSIASPALGGSSPEGLPSGRLFGELSELLSGRNGFYAMEGTLHVFGSGRAVVGRSLEEWNDNAGWRAEYDGLADDYLFFAEDVFGSQFALLDDRVLTFDPETGDSETMATSLEDWADKLLAEPDILAGSSLGHSWQLSNGALTPGARLAPKRPFVLGGDFVESNLYMLDAVQGMSVRAELALQIRDLPDGTQIRYRIVG